MHGEYLDFVPSIESGGESPPLARGMFFTQSKLSVERLGTTPQTRGSSFEHRHSRQFSQGNPVNTGKWHA